MWKNISKFRDMILAICVIFYFLKNYKEYLKNNLLMLKTCLFLF